MVPTASEVNQLNQLRSWFTDPRHSRLPFVLHDHMDSRSRSWKTCARFPPPTWWNVHDRTISRLKLNRTNNYLEAWNKQFAALVGHAHPTIWNFMSSMFMEQSSTDERMLLQRNGDEPPRRKKCHVIRDTRLYHRVLAYDSESLDDVATLISYLDSLRDIMAELD